MFYLSEFCLLCLNSQQLKSVLMHNDKGIALQEQLTYCLPEITISTSGFPEFICSSCHEIVYSYCKFKKICLENYSRLKQYAQILQGASDSRGQKFTELRIQTKKLVIREQEQDIGSELNLNEKIEDSLQSLEEHGQNTDSIDNGEEFTENSTDLRRQINNQESMTDQEQEVDINVNIKNEIQVFLPSLEECDEKLVAFDIADVKQEFVASENSEDHEFNVNHVQNESSNNQDSVSGGSCESDNQSNTDEANFSANTVNVNATCNNRDISEEDHEDYKCPVCNKRFPKQSSLNAHMKIHKGFGDRTAYCKICNKQLSTMKNMSRHLKLHAGIKNFKCSICDKKFAAKSILETHIKMHVGIRDFECSLCDKKFVVKSHLRLHMKIHADIKDHECSVCGKKFVRKYELNFHMSIHTGERNFKCSVCGKKFRQKGHMNRHLKAHMKIRVKNDNCPVCDMKFVGQDSLNKHMKIHEDVVLYECSICKMKFVSNIMLDDHMRIHSANKSELVSVPKSTEYILGLE